MKMDAGFVFISGQPYFASMNAIVNRGFSPDGLPFEASDTEAKNGGRGRI
ncbi:MAG: hypothetical protein ACK5JP_03310 [Akkermansiaceae bacterium]